MTLDHQLISRLIKLGCLLIGNFISISLKNWVPPAYLPLKVVQTSSSRNQVPPANYPYHMNLKINIYVHLSLFFEILFDCNSLINENNIAKFIVYFHLNFYVSMWN